MKKYIAEFIGTFFLVLTIGCTIVGGGAGVIPPLAIGGALMVMVYACGHISGAHFNPAITFAIFVRGRCDAKDVVPYWIFQVVGATLAAFCVKWMFPDSSPTAMSPQVAPALVAEFLFTFALAWVVLNVASSKGTANNSFYGLAIGMTVMAGAFAVGGISGGVFNPSVAVGISIMGLSTWANIWIYLVAQFAAALVAGFVFKSINTDDPAPAEID